MSETVTIGVLACQGAFREHLVALKRVVQDLELSLDLVEVRNVSQLDSNLRGLIIPGNDNINNNKMIEEKVGQCQVSVVGGESTTLNIFFGQEDFLSKLKQWMSSTNPPPIVWGTCAGLIVLSDQVEHEKSGGQLEVWNTLHNSYLWVSFPLIAGLFHTINQIELHAAQSDVISSFFPCNEKINKS